MTEEKKDKTEVKETKKESIVKDAKEKPQWRQLIILTDGQQVKLGKRELSVLEVKMVCMMIIKELGG